MNYSFEYIDIILLAMIAGFIFLRLRGILGKRTGFEGKPVPQFEEILKNSRPNKEDSNQVFDETAQKDFLKGAKIAYETIITDFSDNDNKLTTSKPLLSKKIYDQFNEALSERSKRGHFAEITLQPLKRFELDAAIIFSDILILPYGLNQEVKFKKNFGPQLGNLNLDTISKLDEIDFVKKIYPVYKAINLVSNNKLTENKNTIGFVGAPWTLLVYMLNKHSPKLKLKDNFFKDDFLINRILIILEKYLKLHIKNQIDNGANVIQIFDISWKTNNRYI